MENTMFKKTATASILVYALVVLLIIMGVKKAIHGSYEYRYDAKGDTCIVKMEGNITEVNDRFIKCMIERDDSKK